MIHNQSHSPQQNAQLQCGAFSAAKMVFSRAWFGIFCTVKSIYHTVNLSLKKSKSGQLVKYSADCTHIHTMQSFKYYARRSTTMTCEKINKDNTFKLQQIVIWKCKAISSVIPVKVDNIIQHFFLQHINFNKS